MTRLDAVGRWEPDAAGRLRAAAMQLYVERGFEQTTVAEIANGPALTARTFFRYFADKREVLFAGSAELQEQLVRALEAAPASATPDAGGRRPRWTPRPTCWARAASTPAAAGWSSTPTRSCASAS